MAILGNGGSGIVTGRRYKGSFGGTGHLLFPAPNSSYTVHTCVHFVKIHQAGHS